MTQELWLSVPGFQNYEVSSLGKERRMKTNTSGKAGNILVGYKDKDGYHCVLLYANGARKIKKVHRLVVEAFIDHIQTGMQVNHKNGIKDDNQLENLEIVTPSENTKHGFRVLGRKPTTTGKTKGTKHHNARFSDDDIREIRRLHSNGVSQYRLARIYLASQSHIGRIVHRELWSHVS